MSVLAIARPTGVFVVIWATVGLACQSAPREAQAPTPKALPLASPTPRPRASVERTGTIEISTTVTGAVVTVDGQPRGQAPQRIIGLSPGAHRVRIEAKDHEPWEGSVTVMPDVAVPLQARLLPSPAGLRVTCDVPGAAVFLDRKFVGNAPVEVGDLAPGRYTLKVSAEGYDIYSEALRLGPGRKDVRVQLKAVRLDEALNVVHRHALGSCRGRLSASPEGIAFASTDPKHSFQASLDDVREIRSEYLRKNLEIKLRDGRKFNFTTDDDNADALMAFEQSVSKARALARQAAQ